MRILIVDDEKNIRRTMTIALETMEHAVTCASNSATALAELRKAPFDVVLLDLKLSSESGARCPGGNPAHCASGRGGDGDGLCFHRDGGGGNAARELESRLGADGPDHDLTSQSPAMQKVLNVAFKAAES